MAGSKVASMKVAIVALSKKKKVLNSAQKSALSFGRHQLKRYIADKRRVKLASTSAKKRKELKKINARRLKRVRKALKKIRAAIKANIKHRAPKKSGSVKKLSKKLKSLKKKLTKAKKSKSPKAKTYKQKIALIKKSIAKAKKMSKK